MAFIVMVDLRINHLPVTPFVEIKFVSLPKDVMTGGLAANLTVQGRCLNTLAQEGI